MQSNATFAKNSEIKEIYLELMRSWHELADQVQRLEYSWLDIHGWTEKAFIEGKPPAAS
jgi:hypothetical protein